ncbi:hypothetical protein HDU77_007186 [Chytriomyces hyalinus]|nr:hypothetical protein HDU77_007186 [Chytriomyces hyalinus]
MVLVFPEGYFLCGWFAFCLLSSLMYHLRREKPLIKARPATLTINQTLSNLAAIFFIHSPYLVPVPCFVRAWAINFAIVIWSTTTLVRNFQLYVQYRFNQNLLFKNDKRQASGAINTAPPGAVDEFGYPILPASVDAPNAEIKKDSSEMGADSEESLHRKGVGLKRAFIRLTDKWMIDKVVYKRINRIMFGMYVLTGLYMIMAQFMSPSMAVTPTINFLCTFDLIQYGLLAGGVFFLLICGGIFSMWLIHDITDSNFITYDCLITYCVGLPSGIIFLAFVQIPSLTQLHFNPNWIIVIPLFTSQITSIAFPVILTFWEDFKSRRVKIDMNLVSFKAALEERQLFEEIKEYAIRDMCGENVFFLEALKELRKEAIAELAKFRSRAPSFTERKSSSSIVQMGFTTSKHSRMRTSSIQAASENKQSQEALRLADLPSVPESSSSIAPRPEIDLTSAPPNGGATSGMCHDSQSRLGSLEQVGTIRFATETRTRRNPKDAHFYDNEPVPPSLIYKYKQFDKLYCTAGGQMEVNLSAEVRRNLSSVREAEDWRIGSFDRARLEILNVLFTNVYCRWAHQRLEKDKESKGFRIVDLLKDLHTSKMTNLGSTQAYFLLVWSIVWLLSLSLFLLRRRTRLVDARNVPLSVVQSVASLAAMISICLDSQPDAIPCFIQMWLMNLSIATWIGCQVARNLFLYIQYRNNQSLMRFPGNFGEKKDMGEAGILLTDEFGFPLDQGAADNIPKMRSSESRKSKSRNESDVDSCGSWFTRLVDLYVKDKSVFRRIYWSIACAYVAVVTYLCVAQALTLKFTVSPMAVSPCGLHPFEYASSIAAFVTVYVMGGLASTLIFNDANNNDFVLSDFKLTYFVTLVLAILHTLFQLVPNLKTRWPDSNWILILILVWSHVVSVVLPVWMSFAEERRTSRLMLELTLSSLHQVYDEPVMYQDLKKFAIQDMSGENFFFLESLDALKHQCRIHLLRAQEAEAKNSQPRSSIFHSIHKISTSRSNSVSITSHDRNSSSGAESVIPSNFPSLRVSTMLKPQQYQFPNSSSFSINNLNSFSSAPSPTGTSKSEQDQSKSVKRRLLQHDALQIDSDSSSSFSIDSAPRSNGLSNVSAGRQQKKSLLRNVLRDSVGSRIGSNGSQDSMVQMKGETISTFMIPTHHRRKSPALATASFCGAEAKDSSRSLHFETTSAGSAGGSDKSEKVVFSCSPTNFTDMAFKPSHLVPANQVLQNNASSSSSNNNPQNLSASLFEIPVYRKTDEIDSQLNLNSTSKDAKSRLSLKSIVNDSSFNIAANQRKSQASLGIELKRSSQASISQTSIPRQPSLVNRKSAFSLAPDPKQSQGSLEHNSQSSLGKRKSFVAAAAEVGRNSRSKFRRLSPEEEAALGLKPVPKSLISDYNHVFELYCSESAMFAVNLSAGTRGHLKEVFRTQNWIVGDFSKAREEVFSNIFSNVFCRWVMDRRSKQPSDMRSIGS